MAVTKISKYHLNLAGEYRVCAELLKRDIFATVTYGNMKWCDVLAIGPNRRSAVIEVKTSQSKRFVTGFYQKYKTFDQEHPTFWILYAAMTGIRGFDESFFVLTHDEMAHTQAVRNRHVELPWEERSQRLVAGVDNVTIRDEAIAEHQDRWDKIVRWCSEPL